MDYETSRIIKVQEAHSVFLLNSIKHSNPRHNDTSIMVATIGLKNINPDLDIYAQVTLPESRAYLYKAGAKQVICTETISSKIMGMSVVYHGFSTLLINLVTTTYVRNAIETHKMIMEQEKKKPWIPFLKKKLDPVTSAESLWIFEYLDGLGNEIYCVRFSPFFEGMTFIKAVIFIRENLDLTLLAMEYLDNHDEYLKSVSLNPFDEIIHVDKCKAFVIAQSTFHANLVYLFENAKAEDDGQSDKHSTSSTDSPQQPIELKEVPARNDNNEMESFETFFVSEENAYEKTINEEMDEPKVETRPKYLPTRRKVLKVRHGLPPKRGSKKSNNSLGPSQSNISFSSNIETPPEVESPSILTNSSDLDNPISFVSTMSGIDKQIIDIKNVPHVSETEMNKGYLLRLFRSVAPPTFFYKNLDDSGASFKHFLNDFYQSVLENYNLLIKARPKNDFFLLSSTCSLKNHIILVGELKYPLVILATIRSIRKRHFTPILIMVSHTNLHGNPYVDYLYDRLKFFDQVFFLKGNATDVFDLHRCGLLNAEAVVYLSRQYSSHGHNSKPENDCDSHEATDDLIDTSEYLRDAEVIKLIESISYIDSKKFFIMELNNQKNIKFLKQGGCFSKKYGENHSLFKIFRNVSSASVAFNDPLHSLSDKSDEYDQFCLLSELYSSGRIFPISFISKLLAQSFYTDKFNEIIEHMSLDGLCNMSKSSIFQEDCPPNCFGRAAIDVFLELCEISSTVSFNYI